MKMKMDDHLEPPFKRMKEKVGVKMDDLPDLPLEKTLSYLSLEDLCRSRAVSRRWYKMIDSFRVKSLCCSDRPMGFIKEKARLVSGAFAQNFISFISSPRIEAFFSTFGQSILASLKRLRLCELPLNEENRKAFARTLNSFGQLEELGLFRFNCNVRFNRGIDLALNLPVLNSIQLKCVDGIEKLTLDAPRLQKVKLLNGYSSLRLELVHGESVERLVVFYMSQLEVKQLKNLRYLYVSDCSEIDSTFLSGLEQLKECHLCHYNSVLQFFEQKQRYGRADLKIFQCGLALNGPQDPAVRSVSYGLGKENIACLALNPARLADEIPFCSFLTCYAIERVASESTIALLKRFTNLHAIRVDRSVQDIDRLLAVLKNSEHIVELQFECSQPAALFERLPDHCALQSLTIRCAVQYFGFLVRLRDLIHLNLQCPIDTESIRKVAEELPFLSWFQFVYANKPVRIERNLLKQFQVSVGGMKIDDVADLNAAIKSVIRIARRKD